MIRDPRCHTEATDALAMARWPLARLEKVRGHGFGLVLVPVPSDRGARVLLLSEVLALLQCAVADIREEAERLEAAVRGSAAA